MILPPSNATIVALIFGGCSLPWPFRRLYCCWLLLVSLPFLMILGPLIAVVKAWNSVAAVAASLRQSLGDVEKSPVDEER